MTFFGELLVGAKVVEGYTAEWVFARIMRAGFTRERDTPENGSRDP